MSDTYATGDRVQTPDGPGTVISVEPYSNCPYYVDLDDRSGEYSAEYYGEDELSPL